MISSFKFDRALVKSKESLVVVHLLDAEIKRNLKGFLCNLANQYMPGTLECKAGTFS